jgi:hypothetical protein
MATTTNYGWTTPDDTALVKDGAAAIRTLGSSIDTTTKALNPSTTLGDIEYRSATANTNTRLGIGTNGQVLTVAGGLPTWAAGSAAAALTVVKSETSFSAVTEVIADSVFSSTYSDYLIEMYWTSSSTSLLLMNLRAGGSNTSTNYNVQVTEALASAIGTSYVTQPYVSHAINGSFYGSMRLNLFSPNKAEVTNFQADSVVPSGAYTSPKINQMYGFQTASTQFDGIRLYVGNGAITGRYTIYGLSK